MNYTRCLECVPNFSEGSNRDIISKISHSIQQIEGVKLLDVDPGKDTNRTVVTFAGMPEAVIDAAFEAIKTAANLIDMSKHSGKHPRMGATDVCPLIPISGITVREAVELSELLARRVAEELSIPVFLYEYSAKRPNRKNLANIRSGEYEGLGDKFKDPEWRPDFGPIEAWEKCGATAIGVRDFLVAYNVNLNTRSVRRANSVAFDVREKGRVKREGNKLTGKIVRDDTGNPLRIPGYCKSVKAIGWYIEEYEQAQISMNLTNLSETSLHSAFEACRKSADRHGLRVTGSELVGLVPQKVLLDAGRYYLKQQRRSCGIPDAEIIDIAVKSLGLEDLKPFDPSKKIIEHILSESNDYPLQTKSLSGFSSVVASENPTPGGGSVSAYLGSLASSLAAMVANVSANNRKFEADWEKFSEIAESGEDLRKRLLRLVDEDTNAFNEILKAMRMAKSTDDERKKRDESILKATRTAIEIPLRVMELSNQSYNLLEQVVQSGNPNSITDAGVGVYCAHSAIAGAFLNIKINCKGFQDTAFVESTLNKAKEIAIESRRHSELILEIIEKHIQ